MCVQCKKDGNSCMAHPHSQYFLLIVLELTTISTMRECLRESSKRKTIHCHSLLTCIRGASEILHIQHLVLPGIGNSVVSPFPLPLLCLVFPLGFNTHNCFGFYWPGYLHTVGLTDAGQSSHL